MKHRNGVVTLGGCVEQRGKELPSSTPTKKWGQPKRVLILGDGALAQDLARVLIRDRPHRFDVKGFLSPNPNLVGTSLVNPTVIGTIDQLFELTEQHKIQSIAVCMEDRRGTLPLESLLDVKSM
ncbi:MAG: hypothetical protein KC643_33130, partial [Nitrospira sp.]|nr:hypothetical protein [Nitrospira sp.]